MTLALSAVDLASWDLKGKAAIQPVCALLGGLRDRVPTYASAALPCSHPPDYLGTLVVPTTRAKDLQPASEMWDGVVKGS